MRYFLPPRRMIYLIEISRLIGGEKKFRGFLVFQQILHFLSANVFILALFDRLTEHY